MTLPGVDDAVVDPAKIRDYLLSDSHPVGRFKSVFFVALGYAATDWQRLAGDLRRHAMDNEADATEHTEYGQKYEVTWYDPRSNGKEGGAGGGVDRPSW